MVRTIILSEDYEGLIRQATELAENAENNAETIQQQQARIEDLERKLRDAGVGVEPVSRKLIYFEDDAIDEPFEVPDAETIFGERFKESISDLERADLYEVMHALLEDEFRSLAHHNIGVFWAKKGSASPDGHLEPVTAKVVTGLARSMSGLNGVLLFAHDVFETRVPTLWQVEQIVRHGLMHFRNEDGKLAVRPHDFSGFYRELSQQGAWNASLERALAASMQAPIYDRFGGVYGGQQLVQSTIPGT